MPSALLASASVRPADRPAGSAELADLFFCLAAAFLPPPAQLGAQAWADALAEDLEALGAVLGIATALAVARLRAVADAGTAEPWLVQYSQLFLVPPVAVTLNTGVYLEGALGGASAQMMGQCYATAGFARRDGFHDLPDHVGIQFEFVGALLERALQGDADAAAMAREFIDAFVCHWIGPLHAACVRAAERSGAAPVYAALTDVARAALEALE